jgi:hypothetical protein
MILGWRQQAIQDVELALDAVTDAGKVGNQEAALANRHPLWLNVAILSLVIAISGISAYLLGKRKAPPHNILYQQLTFDDGYAGPSRFTPDATSIASSDSHLGTTRSSGFCRRILPRPLVRTPSRCQAASARLTVKGVTFAPAARSSFPT